MAVRLVALAVAMAIASGAAYAQAPEAGPTGQPEVPVELMTPSEVLRASMDSASAGDWARVSQLMETLLRGQLGQAELAEAHRLAGLAAFFQDRKPDAERHFIAYLRLDLDGQLDAALYPPDVIVFFTDVKAKYGSELRARRPKPKRYAILSVLPPFAQFQNGDRTKGWILTGGLVALLGTSATTYFMLRSWCDDDRTCDGRTDEDPAGRDRTSAAGKARIVNLASGIGLVLTFAYGVYDGVSGYRRNTRERATPYVSSSRNDVFFGVAGAF